MKKNNFFVVALAALTMFSCSKEEITNEVPSGEKANVTISLHGTETRANTSTVPHTNDQKVNNYIVFFFTEGGALVSKHYVADPTAADANKLTSTTAAKKAYIVANTGALAGGIFKDVNNLSSLEAVSGSLSTATAAPHAISTQTGTNVWMAGKGDVAGAGTSLSANVTMKFLSAKVTVIVNDQRTNNTDASKIKITNRGIVLLNAGGKANFFANDVNQMIQTNYFNGDVSYPNPANNTSATFLSEAYTANGAYFYAFGNSSEAMPTILAIKADREANGAAATSVYYPVAFSATDAGASDASKADFIPGNSYTVTLTLKGDVAGGGGGGTIDPEEPLVNADITVNITQALWKVVPVGKEFN